MISTEATIAIGVGIGIGAGLLAALYIILESSWGLLQ